MFKNQHGLTAKQEKFAQAVANTGSLSQAYREAYDSSGMKPESVHNRAYALSKKSEIKSRVEALAEEKRAREQWDRDQAQSFVRERLITESVTAKDARDRLKAVELLGQLAEFDLFATKRVEKVVKRHPEPGEAQERLKRAIERALADG